MPSSRSLPTILQTTLALIDQFSSSLDNTNGSEQRASSGLPPTKPQINPSSDQTPPPLPLLSAAAKSLKAQVTKLSLLTITPPFTPSAVSDILSTLNDSVLPSLVTAALLVAPKSHTTRFHRETAVLAKAALRDLAALVGLVGRQRLRKADAETDEKKEVTEATGRVWEGCDTLIVLADEGVAGFVAKRAEEYLALVKDAVKELEEWDPDEEDDGFDDPADSEDEGTDGNAMETKVEETVDGDLRRHRDEALTVLRRVPMSLHVVIKNRLRKGAPNELENPHVQKLDTVLETYKTISNTVDEAAGTLYEGDVEQSQRHVQEAKMMTVEVVKSFLHPLTQEHNQESANGAANGESKEDRYVQKALDWIEAAGSDKADLSTAGGTTAKKDAG